MEQYLTEFKDWVIELGDKHGVNPLLLGCLYLVSKLSLFSFLGWVVKNLRAKKPFMVQLLAACVSFCIPYSYLIIAGKNISVWVYVFVASVFLYGGFTIWKTITKKKVEVDAIA